MNEVRKSISFKCRSCQSAAKIVERDGRIDRVYCPACGVALDAVDARFMYQTLIERIERLRVEGARNFSRSLIDGRVGRVPRRKVANEFSDTRWPFILVAEDDA